MRALHLAAGCALLFGACLLPEYRVVEDGGTSGGAGGASGRGGSSAGTAGRGGAGGAATGTAGAMGGGTAGSAGGAGGVNATGGTGGAVTGVGGTTAGTGGGGAGRGGTTGSGGIAGTAGRGGTTGMGGVGGGTAGRGGTIGTGGTGGGTAGRGGTTGAGGIAGTGGSGTGGSTVAPNWLQSIAVVYQFDGPQGQIGSEAHGNEALHLEEDTNDSLLPTSDMTNAIEGNSGRLPGPLSAPAYFRSRSGAALPGVFQTEPGTSFTTGGWFRIDPSLSSSLQFLVNDEGPGTYQGGFVFYLDQTAGSFGARAASAYCRVGTSDANFNYKELQTGGNIGPDSAAGNRWAHLVCRFDAATNQLSIYVAGTATARGTDTTHPIKTGPGPFMVGCDVTSCAFVGNVDEVFYATTALSDAAIARIYACGIDGSRCRCNSSSYATCGFATPATCLSLPSCNSPTPP